MDFGINYNINDLIKINNQRFILTSSSKTYYELYIVVFDINESPNIAVFIRYYKIPLKLYHSKLFLASFKNYNGFLSLILASDITNQNTTQLFSILSYINGIDSETINLENNYKA